MLDQLTAAFEETARVTPLVKRRYRVANLSIEVEAAGAELAAILYRPFQHLEEPSPGAPPDVRWRIVDAELWPDPRPRLPPPRDPGRYGYLQGTPEDAILIERRLFTDSAYDVATRCVTTLCWSRRSLTLHERSKPLLRFLFIWLLERGLHVTHTAVLGREGRGVAVTGPGGVGKSTLTAAALRAGLDVLGDDYVAVETTAEGCRGHALFGSLMLHAGHIRRFDDLVTLATFPRADADEKALLQLTDRFSPNCPDGCRSRRSPCRSSSTSRARRWSRARGSRRRRPWPSSRCRPAHGGSGRGSISISISSPSCLLSVIASVAISRH